jgi:hypothetical protein
MIACSGKTGFVLFVMLKYFFSPTVVEVGLLRLLFLKVCEVVPTIEFLVKDGK